jgi:arylsulfatase A-like enzyme
LADLQQRGLLDSTLVVWGGEFGRLPIVQKGGTGRDHNPHAFTYWLAGGGVKPGVSYGATDEIGHKSVENRVSVNDLHATILHLLGIDHERLTFKFQGRHYRLTDVHGKIVRGILA